MRLRRGAPYPPLKTSAARMDLFAPEGESRSLEYMASAVGWFNLGFCHLALELTLNDVTFTQLNCNRSFTQMGENMAA